MDKHGESAQMLGKRIEDAHANTAKCGRVNDRLRRAKRRVEKEQLKSDVKSGVALNILRPK